jgi:HEAT repeat protein
MRTPCAIAILLFVACTVVGAADPAPRKEELRYDGKSFEAWRAYARTELKPERCVEAVEALTVFGINGYGDEAAATILEVTARFLERPWSGKVIEKSGECLSGMEELAVPVLLKALSDRRRQVQEFSIVRLSKMSTACPASAAPVLLELVQDRDWFVSNAALIVLANIKDLPTVLAKLLKNSENSDRFIIALANRLDSTGDSEGYCYAAERLLTALGSKARLAVPALLQRLVEKDRDGDSYTQRSRRLRAVTLLGVIRSEPEQVVPALMRLAAVEGPEEVRSAAVDSLGAYKAPAAAPFLKKLVDAPTKTNPRERGASLATSASGFPLGSPSVPQKPTDPKTEEPAQIKLAAALALDRLEGRKDGAGKMLFRLLRDLKDTEDRQEFLSNLESPVMAPLTPDLIKAFEVFEDDRVPIARTLGKMGPAAAEALPLLKRASHDENSKLREAAAEAIKAIESKPEKR